MRIAYFDCFSGISGDMTLGALLDAGADIDAVSGALGELGLGELGLETRRTSKHSIAATAVDILVDGRSIPAEHDSHIHGDHSGHSVAEIYRIVEGSALTPDIKSQSIEVFERLAAAEARVHGTSVDRVHLHEAGAMDAIADVVGSIAALSSLGVHRVFSSRLRFGTGFAKCSHGRLPVPVPAVVELCKDLPCEQTDIAAELVTPTGAALITTLAEGFGSAPPFTQECVGYGSGKRDLDAIPNLLRVRIGEQSSDLHGDHCMIVEANIDDMNPEIFGYLFEQLFECGARDVYVTPVLMKKGRPGHLLSALVDAARLDEVVRAVLRETTSLGVRYYLVERRTLERSAATVATRYGPVKVKVSEFDGKRRYAPEYDDCLRVAKEQKVPILSIYSATRDAVSEE